VLLLRLLELTGAKEPAALEKLVKAVGVKPASVNKDLLMYKGVLSKLSSAKVCRGQACTGVHCGNMLGVVAWCGGQGGVQRRPSEGRSRCTCVLLGYGGQGRFRVCCSGCVPPCCLLISWDMVAHSASLWGGEQPCWGRRAAAAACTGQFHPRTTPTAVMLS
jgi:hypothetical protein